MYAGIESKNLANFVASTALNHKRKRFVFGELKSAVAKKRHQWSIIRSCICWNNWSSTPTKGNTAVSITSPSANDLKINHDSNNSYISQEGTGDLFIRNTTDDKDILLKSDDGSGSTTTYLQLDGSDVSTKILTQKVIMSNLPTSDPSNAGQLWNDSGTLKISAG